MATSIISAKNQKRKFHRYLEGVCLFKINFSKNVFRFVSALGSGLVESRANSESVVAETQNTWFCNYHFSEIWNFEKWTSARAILRLPASICSKLTSWDGVKTWWKNLGKRSIQHRFLGTPIWTIFQGQNFRFCNFRPPSVFDPFSQNCETFSGNKSHIRKSYYSCDTGWVRW